MKPARLVDDAGDLRRRLADPRRLCEVLGLMDGAKPQSGGLLIRCPWHEDRTPSCSVRVAADGTIGIRCFGCDVTGDALDLVAVVNGLDTGRDFLKVRAVAAELAGVSLDVDRPAPPPRPSPPAPERSYPPQDQLAALWEVSAVPVTEDPATNAWLRSRDVDPVAIEDRDLARALPADAALPPWARSRWGTWTESGHTCVFPMFDELGQLRAVRARRVVERDDGAPKCLPPTGHRASGIIMADSFARQLLVLGRRPDFWPAGADLQIGITEGEPDYAKYSTAWPDSDLVAPAILGIVNGSWSPAIAARIPSASTVFVLTHEDDAGDGYAAQIIETLRGRVTLRRGPP